jgi:hypothetical protein
VDQAQNKKDNKPLFTKMCIKFGYFNVKSVNNKSSEINDEISEIQLDICAITDARSWNGDEFIKSGDLTPEVYKLHHVPRDKGRGGGVAIIHKTSFICKKIKTSKASTYDSMELPVPR